MDKNDSKEAFGEAHRLACVYADLAQRAEDLGAPFATVEYLDGLHQEYMQRRTELHHYHYEEFQEALTLVK